MTSINAKLLPEPGSESSHTFGSDGDQHDVGIFTNNLEEKDYLRTDLTLNFMDVLKVSVLTLLRALTRSPYSPLSSFGFLVRASRLSKASFLSCHFFAS